jgi:hypothetical protein
MLELDAGVSRRKTPIDGNGFLVARLLPLFRIKLLRAQFITGDW